MDGIQRRTSTPEKPVMMQLEKDMQVAGGGLGRDCMYVGDEEGCANESATRNRVRTCFDRCP